MKRLIFFLASTAFLLGCQNENSEVIVPGSLTGESYIIKNNFVPLTGIVEFKASKNENLVFFNLGKENQKLFYLQTQNLEQFTSSKGQGEVFVSPDERMIIVSTFLTGEVLIMTLNDRPVPNDIFPNRTIKTIKGYGIGEAWGEGILELYKMADLFSIFGPKESARAGSGCDAGGLGSNYCTVSSQGNYCSVSCSSGYYACCNITTSHPYVSCACSPESDPEQRVGIVSANENL